MAISADWGWVCLKSYISYKILLPWFSLLTVYLKTIMLINLISIPFFYHHIFSLVVIRYLRGGKLRAFGGMSETQNCNKSRFSISANLLIFLSTECIQLFHVWKWSDCVETTEERVARTSCLCVKRDAPPRLPPTKGPFLKRPYLWRYGTHINKTVQEKNVEVRKQVRAQ